MKFRIFYELQLPWPCGSDDERQGPAYTTRRKRKMRCTTRINIPMMTICSDEAAAMVGSPCH